MIRYLDTAETVSVEQLHGFFVGWPDPPSPETHLKILQGSYRVILAEDADTGRIVGFVNAVSDGILSAYIPLLEVLPEYQGRGIGTELLRRMIAGLSGLYMVDLVCDHDRRGFYEKAGMTAGTAMMKRDYGVQSGRALTFDGR